jgi:hypothetical protein
MPTTRDEIRGLLLSLLPPGHPYDLTPHVGDAWLIFDSYAEGIRQQGYDFVDRLRRESLPSTCIEKLPDWEEALSLAETRIAKFGTTAQRQAQVVAHLRKRGAPAGPHVQAAVQPFLGYADPSTIRIITCDRTALTLEHIYSLGGLVLTANTTRVATVRAGDAGAVARMGAQLRLNLTHAHPEDLTIALLGPNGSAGQAAHSWTLPPGALVAADVFLNAPDAAGKTIDGVWTLGFVCANTGHNGTLNAAEIFVEGVGRDVHGIDGRGAQMGDWAVLVEISKCSSSAPDLDAVENLLARMAHAHTHAFAAVAAGDGTDWARADEAAADRCICG